MWIYQQDTFFITILIEYFLNYHEKILISLKSSKNIENKDLKEKNIILYLNIDFYFLEIKHEIKMRFLKITILWNLIHVRIIVNFNSE